MPSRPSFSLSRNDARMALEMESQRQPPSKPLFWDSPNDDTERAQRRDENRGGELSGPGEGKDGREPRAAHVVISTISTELVQRKVGVPAAIEARCRPQIQTHSVRRKVANWDENVSTWFNSSSGSLLCRHVLSPMITSKAERRDISARAGQFQARG